MKQFFIAVVVIFGLSLTSALHADSKVKGYYKKDGMYVAPYHRTGANGSTSDNYSHQGNTNPYTGQPGTKTN